MRSRINIFFSLVVVLLSIFSVRTYTVGQNSGKKPVDLRSDRIFPVPIGDSTGYALTGDVILYHNGTVITCDSMVRYDARHMDCFGNVVINQDSLYIYGDRVEYNGDNNMARVYSPLIKITDGNAVMYTYFFSFNTNTNVGEFDGGGTVAQGEYLMESQKGFYFADNRVMVGTGDVQMRSSSYVMMSDSVSYNLNTEQATFHKRSNIWNDKGEILSADSGDYFKPEDRYKFYSNAYILSEEQEIWADSLDYASTDEELEMWRNIQAVDTGNMSMAFGDYAHYMKSLGKGILTENPSVVRYEENNADTLYMRSDTIYVFEVDSLGFFELNRPDSGAVFGRVMDELPREEEFSYEEFASEMAEQQNDEQQQPADLVETKTATVATDERSLRRQRRENARNERKAKKTKRQTQTDSLTDKDTLESEKDRSDTDLKEDLTHENNSIVETEQTVQIEEEEQTKELVLKDGEEDGLSEIQPEGEVNQNDDDVSAPIQQGDESLYVEDGDIAIQQGDSEEIVEKEQSDKVVVAFRNVKIFRNDFQAVCDSLLGFTVDSTIEMHIKPILWNETNQITSSDVQIFTKDQQLQKAVFTGNPIMASLVDSTRYNQVNGKTIMAFFDDGVIDKVDVNGNVKTYYYMVDDADGTVQGFLDVKSADLTFEMEDKRVVRITFRTEPEYVIYPMDQIPVEITQKFDGFEWESDLRPDKQAVFTRIIRPSERDYYEMLKRPDFTITSSIDNYRKQLIENGYWADRDDTINEDTIYFISTRQQ